MCNNLDVKLVDGDIDNYGYLTENTDTWAKIDINDYKAAVSKIKSGEKALVLIYRNGAIVYVPF